MRTYHYAMISIASSLPGLFWSTTIFTIERIMTGWTFIIVWYVGGVVKLLFDRSLLQILGLISRILKFFFRSQGIVRGLVQIIIKGAGTASVTPVQTVAILPSVILFLNLK
jgi:hypothetical protein